MSQIGNGLCPSIEGMAADVEQPQHDATGGSAATYEFFPQYLVTDVKDITVSSFYICSCQHPNYPQPHLAVSTYSITLQHGSAVAVSYAIGDFHRATHLVGHELEHVDKPIALQLGGEWNLSKMISLLANITSEKSAVWFDQLSISQDDESIQAELQHVPDIYSTLEVIVLLPNTPCKCLTEAFAKYEAGDEYYMNPWGDFRFGRVYQRCPLSAGVSSYCCRLWTKQEFGYARQISAHFCDDVNAECWSRFTAGREDWHGIPPGDHSQYFNRYFQWLYDECQRSSSRQGDAAREFAWSLMSNHVELYFNAFTESIWQHFRRGDEYDEKAVPTFALQANLLLGKQFKRAASECGERLLLFDDLVSPHKVSMKKDYVLAVFPGVEKYRVPQHWKSMDLHRLLDDAFEQNERGMDAHWISLLPKGLFELGWGSSRCRPTMYINPDKITDYRSVYGSLRTIKMREATQSGSVRIRYRSQQAQSSYRSRLLRSQTYQSAFGTSGTETVLKFMRDLGFIWVGHHASNAFLYWAQRILGGVAPVPTERWPCMELEVAMFSALLHLEGYRDWADLLEIDHHEVVYQLVCSWASIDPMTAREKGLELVVSTEAVPCIGLFNGMVAEGLRAIEKYRAEPEAKGLDRSAPAEEKSDTNTLLTEDWLSLPVTSTQSSNIKHGDCKEELVYEALKMPTPFDEPWLKEVGKDSPMPLYHVVGVWYYTFQEDDSIGAEVVKTRSWEEADALLV